VGILNLKVGQCLRFAQAWAIRAAWQLATVPIAIPIV